MNSFLLPLTVIGIFAVMMCVILIAKRKKAAALLQEQTAPPPADPVFHSNSDLTAEDQRYVACGANLAYMNRMPLNTLGSGIDGNELREMLQRDWLVSTQDELLDKIEWLQAEGHRVFFQAIWNILFKMDNKDHEQALELLQQSYDEQGITGISVESYTHNILAGHRYVHKYKGFFDAGSKIDALTWDLGRLINLARWGFDAGLLSREAALAHIRSAGRQLLNNYGDWKNMGENFVIGFAMWNGGMDELEEVCNEQHDLLTKPASPWLQIPW